MGEKCTLTKSLPLQKMYFGNASLQGCMPPPNGPNCLPEERGKLSLFAFPLGPWGGYHSKRMEDMASQNKQAFLKKFKDKKRTGIINMIIIIYLFIKKGILFVCLR